MDNSTNPFKKVGTILIAIGLADISFMVYCIINEISYSSSFNIFAVIAGIFLLRGSANAAEKIKKYSGFFMTAFGCMIFALPILMPLDLIAVKIKLAPVETAGLIVMTIAFTGAVVWTHIQMLKPEADDFYQNAGISIKKPIMSYIGGVALVVLITSLLTFMNNSESGEKAIALAKEKHGDNYSYHIESMSMSGGRGSATVLVYNDTEIKQVRVEW